MVSLTQKERRYIQHWVDLDGIEDNGIKYIVGVLNLKQANHVSKIQPNNPDPITDSKRNRIRRGLKDIFGT